MTMTRDNYEPFFLDYLEGNLDENLIDQFLDFLEQNPDLKEELHLFENIHLPQPKVVFSGKEQLYKSVHEEDATFELKAVALLEGDLKDEDSESFKTYLASHPELEKEYRLFEKTRLLPDTGIKFQDKQKLYKKSRTTIIMTWTARVAAVALIIWGVSSLFKTEVKTSLPASTTEIAINKPTLVNPVKTSEPEINKTKETKIQEKPAAQTSPKQKASTGKIEIRQEKKPATSIVFPERDLTVPEEITPIFAQLEAEPIGDQLAVSHSINTEKINGPLNVMSVEEFLASRAKKVGNQGLLSAQRILRAGLTVASEISGERIDYTVKNGKISSIGFESKLMAFSIPLQKK